jgi:ATP-binding cassette subfamily C protein
MAHRPAAIRECDRLLVLDAGAPRLFGPTAEVLKRMIANDGDIRRAAGRATGAA